MPRRREVPKRTILPDPKYHDQTLAKFVNVIMLDGKKSIAERIIYGALDIIGERTFNAPARNYTISSANRYRQQANDSD